MIEQIITLDKVKSDLLLAEYHNKYKNNAITKRKDFEQIPNDYPEEFYTLSIYQALDIYYKRVSLRQPGIKPYIAYRESIPDKATLKLILEAKKDTNFLQIINHNILYDAYKAQRRAVFEEERRLREEDRILKEEAYAIEKRRAQIQYFKSKSKSKATKLTEKQKENRFKKYTESLSNYQKQAAIGDQDLTDVEIDDFK